jgi:hypothetical protein
LLSFASSALAADIRAGAIMQVTPNSIWFDEAADLAKWQALKKAGDAAALAAYEKDRLGSRNAWQFINPLTVKVLTYQSQTNQVEVEMKTKGRFEGLHMFLDAGALVR